MNVMHNINAGCGLASSTLAAGTNGGALATEYDEAH